MQTVADAQSRTTPLQPCLRDIWHDHVLFEGDRVTGLIDFGAMRMESPAGDVARLLGSLVENDSQGWQTGLQAYQKVRPLLPAEYCQLAAFDAANIILAGLNWIQWLFVERRRFEDGQQIVSRLRQISRRLDQFAKQVWPFRA